MGRLYSGNWEKLICVKFAGNSHRNVHERISEKNNKVDLNGIG